MFSPFSPDNERGRRPARSAFAIFSCLLGLLVAEGWGFPVKAGTSWTYEAGAGGRKTLFVEGLGVLSGPGGRIHVATLRRGDGADRFLFRSAAGWYECRAAFHGDRPAGCAQPLLFFRAAPAHGQKWQSGGLTFLAEGPESLDLAFRRLPRVWKVSYSPADSADPMGTLWVDETFGRVRIEEGGVDYRLAQYAPGSGPELEVTADKAVDALVREASPAPAPSRSLLRRYFSLPWDRKWLLAVGFPLAVFVPIFLLAVGLWVALRRRSGDIAMEGEGPSAGEIRLVAALARGGDATGARTRLEEMAAGHPHYPDLRHQLALIYVAEGRWEEARDAWEASLRINPKYVEARLAYAQFLCSRREFDRAVRHYEEAVRANPSYADALLGLGRAHLGRGDRGQAEATLRRALTINPGLAEAHALLAECQKSAPPAIAAPKVEENI